DDAARAERAAERGRRLDDRALQRQAADAVVGERHPERGGRAGQRHPAGDGQGGAGLVRPGGQVHHLPQAGGVQRALDHSGGIPGTGGVGAEADHVDPVHGGVLPVGRRGGRGGERLPRRGRAGDGDAVDLGGTGGGGGPHFFF